MRTKTLEVLVTIRRLPDTDLARIAPLDAANKRRALERFRLGHAPYSYEPTREVNLDLLNARTGFFDDLPDTPWESLKRQITRRAGSSPHGVRANVEVAKLLYDWARHHRPDTVHRDFGVFGSQSIRYWSNVVMIWDDRPVILFIDFRRQALAGLGMRFAASVMNDRVRELSDDLRDARLGFIQFPEADANSRGIRLVFSEETDLYTHDNLVDMVDETYRIWGEVSLERTEEVRRRSAGGL